MTGLTDFPVTFTRNIQILKTKIHTIAKSIYILKIDIEIMQKKKKKKN